VKPDRWRILVLYWHDPTEGDLRLAIQQHLHVLDVDQERFEVLYYNTFEAAPAWLKNVNFDAIVLHTTFLGGRWRASFYTWKWELRWIKEANCVKIALPQDEYDHSEILDEWLYELGVSVIFSCFGEEHYPALYPLMQHRARFYKVLTGFIDEADAQNYMDGLPKPGERPNDIVYRAAHLPYWFGRQGYLKHQIADVVAERATQRGLKCDISTHPKDTIVGNRWMRFLASGRAVIGCESGSSVLDRRGEIRARIQNLLVVNPQASYQEVARQMPAGWDDYRFFAISPRHFEAIITRTCQVLIEGSYDGILEPHKHYIPLKRDFSNLDEVLEKIRDDTCIGAITEQAYQDIYLSGKYSYRQFAKDIEQAIAENLPARRTGSMWLGNMILPIAKIAAWRSER